MKTKVVQGAFAAPGWWRKTWIWITLLIVALVAAGIVIGVHVRDSRRSAQAALAEQRAILAELNDATFLARHDTQVIQDTTKLINGHNTGRYKISKSELGQAYLDRATAYQNTGKTTAALADYGAAMSADGSTKIPALQAELSIESQRGNTAALVPILRQLVILFQHSTMPLAIGQAAQYQEDIQAIQSGQEVSF